MRVQIPCLLSPSGLTIRSMPVDADAREEARQFLVHVRPVIDLLNFTAARLEPSDQPFVLSPFVLPTPPPPLCDRLPRGCMNAFKRQILRSKPMITIGSNSSFTMSSASVRFVFWITMAG